MNCADFVNQMHAGCNFQWLWPTYPGALALAVVTGLAALIVWAIVSAAWRWYRARRNDRQVRDHLLSRRAFRAAGRRGLSSEDTQ